MQTSTIAITLALLLAVGSAIAWYASTRRNDTTSGPRVFEASPELAEFLKNQVKYRGGGEDEIACIADDIDLSHAVFMWCLPDESDYSVALAEVAQQNAGRRAVYLVNTLDYEVCNGGFNQYFYNKGAVLAKETIKSLRHIGETKRADLLQAALEQYAYVEDDHRAAQTAGPPKAQLEAFSKTYADNPLGDLDGLYYKAGPDMWRVVANYIRTHADEFTD
jgi:hypothetical protein